MLGKKSKLNKKINLYLNKLQKNTGLIYTVKDGIAEAKGLVKVCSGELVYDSQTNFGIVLNLLRTSVGVVFFSDFFLKVGNLVMRRFHLPQIPTTPLLVGSVLSVLGEDKAAYLRHANSGTSKTKKKKKKKSKTGSLNTIFLPYRLVEVYAPGIIERQSVYESLFTGVKVLDAIIPVGCGQRELIIGDRQTGKTAIAIDAIINQQFFLPTTK